MSYSFPRWVWRLTLWTLWVHSKVIFWFSWDFWRCKFLSTTQSKLFYLYFPLFNCQGVQTLSWTKQRYNISYRLILFNTSCLICRSYFFSITGYSEVYCFSFTYLMVVNNIVHYKQYIKRQKLKNGGSGLISSSLIKSYERDRECQHQVKMDIILCILLPPPSYMRGIRSYYCPTRGLACVPDTRYTHEHLPIAPYIAFELLTNLIAVFLISFFPLVINRPVLLLSHHLTLSYMY